MGMGWRGRDPPPRRPGRRPRRRRRSRDGDGEAEILRGDGEDGGRGAVVHRRGAGVGMDTAAAEPLSWWKNEQECPPTIWSAANGAGPIYWSGPVNWAGPSMFFYFL
jgi:hypothetical protein